MYYKLFVSMLIPFVSSTLLAKNYMMNCISPDFKKAAFYKFDSTNKKLLMRTVKKKWKDLCDYNK